MGTKATAEMLVRGIQSVIGRGFYHSVGDDPGQVKNRELERPHFVMPMWGCDQSIETPKSKLPPDLTSNLSGLGKIRSGRRRDYIAEIGSLRFEPGSTFTFCFWGPSQFLDKLKWRVAFK